MKTKALLSILMLIYITSAVGQNTLELTFSAENNGIYVQLDSIRVMNRTQGGETMIYWPDTTLSPEIMPGDLLLFVGYATFSTVSISELHDDYSSFSVYQNYPNPMGDQSEILIYIPQAGKVHLMITDLQGKVVLLTDRQLEEGHHTFMFLPGCSNFFFLTAHWNGISRSIKMISTGKGKGILNRLEYIGSGEAESVLKASGQSNDFIVFESGILDVPEQNSAYIFQFATNIPCPGTPAVEYEGLVYNTIQIFSQCWLKENLNVGMMIPGGQSQEDNGIVEKHCYDNDTSNCIIYGGLYEWNEMMQYTTLQGTQGICPPGWHIPTDEEWKVLEGAVDSQFGIGSTVWDYWGDHGADAGTNLKTTSGWYGTGNGIDKFGFSGLPSGLSTSSGYYIGIDYNGFWWTSTEMDSFDDVWIRSLSYSHPQVAHYNAQKSTNGMSVRCLRDN